MELHELLETIETKDDLADFVGKLRDDLISNEVEWENPQLERFLEAMSAGISSMHNVYRNLDEIPPSQPSWKTLAEILLVAKMYE